MRIFDLTILSNFKGELSMNKMPFIIVILLLFVSCETNSSKSINNLKRDIEQIITDKKADVGVSILGIEDNDSLNINNKKHFPMQSVFKFHVVLAVLHEVDNGNLSLEKKVIIKKSDLLLNTWSPLREKYFNGDTNFTLNEIINYTVSQSDNNGCDILLRLIGGTEKVNDYIHNLGINDVQIAANEEEMHKEWSVQFKNWTTPQAASELLRLFYNRMILSEKSFDFLWKIMLETKTGGSRIKGKLLSGTLVAHKTGTSDTSESGVTAAINDIGIVTLPNGKHYALSVFVTDSRENYKTNENIIADISELVWNYFVNKKK
jgi:beta-lactamase class A